MDQSAVRNVINEHIRKLRWAMQLHDWEITTDLGGIQGRPTHAEGQDVVGLCRSWPERRRAEISIDHNLISDESYALHVLRHELLHLMHSHFHQIRNAYRHFVTPDQYDCLEDLWQDAAENCVTMLEAMLDYGLGMKPESMIERGDEVLAKYGWMGLRQIKEQEPQEVA